MSFWKILSSFKVNVNFICVFEHLEIIVSLSVPKYSISKSVILILEKKKWTYETILYLITLFIKDILNWLQLYTLTYTKNIQRLV